MNVSSLLSSRISSLGGYAFAEVDKMVANLKDQGVTPIDFGVGDPIDPTPEFIREAAKKSIDERKSSGYPSYIGDAGFRAHAATWIKERFDVTVDPETEITTTIGSKEGVFHFPLGFIDEGDVVISPTPGYPPYQRGTNFAKGENFLLPLKEENDFLPDLSSVPNDVAQRAKILWLCSPNSPTGKIYPDEFWEEAIAWGKKWNVIVVNDECYTEFYFDDAKKPKSLLEFSKDGVVVFHSLSKRSNMTGYRVGWVAGDKNIVDAFKKVKTNIDSGTPTFLQDAAGVALSDETHVAEMRERYRQRKEVLFEAFKSVGIPTHEPDGTFYLWQRAPEGMTGLEFAKKLLDPSIGVVVTPGAWISDEVDGHNPGENYVRFALVPDLETTKRAAQKIRENF